VQKEQRKFADSPYPRQKHRGFGGGGIEKKTKKQQKSSQSQCLTRSDKAYAIAQIFPCGNLWHGWLRILCHVFVDWKESEEHGPMFRECMKRFTADFGAPSTISKNYR